MDAADPGRTKFRSSLNSPPGSRDGSGGIGMGAGKDSGGGRRDEDPGIPASGMRVNGVNVVKVGHKQVVSLIRQGGNRLLMKVVSVSRKPDSEEGGRKKGLEFLEFVVFCGN
ncbi:hypothetical protein DUI87_33353 [Hirundo rustica rustica]|uniref:PDZ domain-containing protein n=1 Tax=Hirundo rustica rustica TaxID=333673 RepID=A0A3M0IMN3_HIRRU|nr:hypothetical protein DUI87_33353 [Hirundo rustica rustica]